MYQFKDIPEFPGYKINSLGKIISPKGCVLIQCVVKGYCKVSLKNIQRKLVFVHRILAQTFIPNIENKPCINHMDGNKTNNSLENLEWVTHQENSKHAINLGLQQPKCGIKNGMSKLREDQVEYIIKHYRRHSRICGSTQLAKRFGVSTGCITQITRQEHWKHLTQKKRG